MRHLDASADRLGRPGEALSGSPKGEPALAVLSSKVDVANKRCPSPSDWRVGMGLVDKAKNEAQKLEGEAKEKLGHHTDDKSMEAEGKKDQAAGSLKNAGENVKDAVN
jgi:uncharacterized protein YjbJ (UPF0337 family)